MKFKFGDKVKVKNNAFFEKREGMIMDFIHIKGVKKIKELYRVDFVNELGCIFKWFNEEDLEVVN